MLCNVTEEVLKQLKATEAYEMIGEENIFPSNPIVGASLDEAWQSADRWIAVHEDQTES
jgi:hypothetical protein